MKLWITQKLNFLISLKASGETFMLGRSEFILLQSGTFSY